jgi:hypothetical protein
MLAKQCVAYLASYCRVSDVIDSGSNAGRRALDALWALRRENPKAPLECDARRSARRTAAFSCCSVNALDLAFPETLHVCALLANS